MPSMFTRLSVVLLAILSTTVSTMADANDKDAQLRQAMADIALLSTQMNQRQSDAETIRDQLTATLKTIDAEARQIIVEKGIINQEQALSHPRLYHDLQLMAEIQAYIDRYSRKIGYYRVASDRLGYLYQQADDDLKIVNTLSDLKIGALVSQTKKILDGYFADAQTLLIDPERLSIAAPEKMWLEFKGDN
jgi:hypothetical protein